MILFFHSTLFVGPSVDFLLLCYITTENSRDKLIFLMRLRILMVMRFANTCTVVTVECRVIKSRERDMQTELKHIRLIFVFMILFYLSFKDENNATATSSNAMRVYTYIYTYYVGVSPSFFISFLSEKHRFI